MKAGRPLAVTCIDLLGGRVRLLINPLSKGRNSGRESPILARPASEGTPARYSTKAELDHRATKALLHPRL